MNSLKLQFIAIAKVTKSALTGEESLGVQLDLIIRGTLTVHY